MRFWGAFLFAAMTTSPALATGWCDYKVPPEQSRQEPTIQYEIVVASADELRLMCEFGGLQSSPRGMIGGCAIHCKDDDTGERFACIFVRDDMDAEEFACIVLHEKAHLPPNRWDHGPNQHSYQDNTGQWRPMPGPRWRRPSHVDPFMFVRGRVGGLVR